MSKFPKNFHENFHLFLSALIVSLIGLSCGYYHESIPSFMEFDYISFYIVLLVCSIPFLVLDPRIWYCIFMTTFSQMLFLKDFYAFSLITVVIMMVGLLIRRNEDSKDDEEQEIFKIQV